MVSPSAQEISALCQSWIDATPFKGGRYLLDRSAEDFRLLRNGVVFADLDYDQLRAAAVGLTTVLLRPGLSMHPNGDHRWFWAWCTELLCGGTSTYFKGWPEQEVKALLGLCCRAALAGTYPPDEEGARRQIERSLSMEHNAGRFVEDATSVLTYLAFPLLEAMTKRHCSEYVSMDGGVIQTFTAEPRGREYNVGETCSSVRDLLWLVNDSCATDELRHDLGEVRAHLKGFAIGDEDGFDVIFRWRNSSLHGVESLPTVGGTVLNVALLIALSEIRDRYEAMRVLALTQVQEESKGVAASGLGDSRLSTSFYPPYLRSQPDS